MKNIVLTPTPEWMALDGLTDTVAPWEDGLRTNVDSPSFEWWYFDAHFDDGSTAVIVFYTKPMLVWKGPAKPQVSMTITRPNGEKTIKFFTSSVAQFSAAKETCDVRVGDSWQIIKNAISDTLERSSWIRLGILYALSLLGALATLIPAGVILGDLLNGIFGETAIWSNFLLEISVAFSVLIPSAVVWRYFQQTLWLDTETLPQISEVAGHRRVYYYVLSLAGLIATFTALQLLAVWLIDMFVPPKEIWGAYPREGLAYILATLLVSLPVWTLHWRPAQLEILKDDEQTDHASRSLVRKGYLYLILFAGVIGTMITAGMLLYQLIQLVLGNADRHSLQTILSLGALLILFVIFSIYHWRCLQADGRRVSKALIEKYAAFPVMVFDTGEGQFAESILSALKTIAPGMPAVVQPAGDPLDERIDSAAAAVIPSNLLTHPPEAVRAWLEQYTGARLVIPVDEKDWLWVGLTDLSAQDMARQAAKMLAQFAEAQDTRQRRIHSPLTIIGYVFGALAGAALLCIASTAILEMF